MEIMKKFYMKKKIKLVLFFNHLRGIVILKTLIQERYEIKKVFYQ